MINNSPQLSTRDKSTKHIIIFKMNHNNQNQDFTTNQHNNNNNNNNNNNTHHHHNNTHILDHHENHDESDDESDDDIFIVFKILDFENTYKPIHFQEYSIVGIDEFSDRIFMKIDNYIFLKVNLII